METLGPSFKKIPSVFTGYELRVITLDSREKDAVLMSRDFRLPRGIVNDDENLEVAARRISAEKYNQHLLTSVARLVTVEDVEGYVVESPTGKSVDLRPGFAARAFALDYLLKDADSAPEKYDPIDVALLQGFSDRSFRI